MSIKTTLTICSAALAPWLSASTNIVRMTPLATFSDGTNETLVAAKAYTDDAIRASGSVTPEMTTNIAGRVTSNVVTKAYVEGLGIASEETDPVYESEKGEIFGMTNAVPRITDGTHEIRADGSTLERIVVSQWYPYNGYTPAPFIGNFRYSGVEWTDRYVGEGMSEGWYSTLEKFTEEGWVQFPGAACNMRGDWTNRDATRLMFPSYEGMSDNTETSRTVTKVQTRLATTNDLHAVRTNAYTKAEADSSFAPTSTAVTVSQQSQQISTLNQGYTRLYDFTTGATNANFTATNYPPTAAAAASKVRWEPEEGMDFTTVPASLQLNERRDGAWRTVMDTRDWTVWYYRFKEGKLTNEIERLKEANAALSNELASARAWANRTANGVENPLSDTLVVDRPNMWLMADYEWQKCVSGSNQCFVIRAKNVALSGGANTNGFLEICDAFGKPYMRVNKSAETFADCVFSNVTYNAGEGAWYVVFGNRTKPTKGGANCEIVGAASGGGKCILYDEDDPECPATITWPNTADSCAYHWVMKAVPKPVDGVVPDRMFFGAEIKVEGKDYVEYVKEASFGAGIRVGNNVYDAVESGNTLIWTKRVE